MTSKINSRRRKIYYVPGLISLIFLPVIFFETLPSNKFFTVIRYVTPSDAQDQPNTIAYTGQYFMKEIKKKKIIPFYLDEDHELNKKKFSIIELESLRLKFTCDTNHVIAIQLSDSLYYGEFISLLNLMAKYKFKRYGDWKNVFYIFGEDPPDPENEIKPIYL